MELVVRRNDSWIARVYKAQRKRVTKMPEKRYGKNGQPVSGTAAGIWTQLQQTEPDGDKWSAAYALLHWQQPGITSSHVNIWYHTVALKFWVLTTITVKDVQLIWNIYNEEVADLNEDGEWRHLVNVVFNKNKQYVEGRFNLVGEATADVSHQISNNLLQ